jgi:two-component system LytT family response regulator
MKIIKAIIVDDEADARDVLETLIFLSKQPIEIIAKCSNLKDAIVKIKEQKPDVVFLDIEMPEFAGYEIVNFFDEINFEIVFVTAFDEYALKAFELSAIDYLVKPIKRVRLNNTLIRIIEQRDKRNAIIEYQVLLDSLQSKKTEKIIIPEIGGNRVLILEDIICIQGQGSYSTIYLKNKGKVTVSKNLKFFDKILYEGSIFFRSQKSWIINTKCVKQFNTNQKNIILQDDIIAKISPTKIAEFILSFKN